MLNEVKNNVRSITKQKTEGTDSPTLPQKESQTTNQNPAKLKCILKQTHAKPNEGKNRLKKTCEHRGTNRTQKEAQPLTPLRSSPPLYSNLNYHSLNTGVLLTPFQKTENRKNLNHYKMKVTNTTATDLHVTAQRSQQTKRNPRERTPDWLRHATVVIQTTGMKLKLSILNEQINSEINEILTMLKTYMRHKRRLDQQPKKSKMIKLNSKE